MKVLKFGGTSVGSAHRIRAVADLVTARGRNIVVLSAMSGTTNTLVQINDYLDKGNRAGAQDTINALYNKYTGVMDELFAVPLATAHRGSRGSAMMGDAAAKARAQAQDTMDNVFELLRSMVDVDFTDADAREILAQGELLSTALMTSWLRMHGVKAVQLPALEFMRLDVDREPDMRYIRHRLKRLMDLNAGADIYITQGFICRNASGEIDNLQRGGSDYTASIIGAATDAAEVQIWTDIDGMHNNDPRYVEGTRPVRELHFEEAAELAYFGAKILHPSCVLPARLANIPVRLLNTMEPDKPGTLICNLPASGTIKSVAAKDSVTVINIKSGRSLVAWGFMRKVFETFEKHRTAIDMIATSEVGVTVATDSGRHIDDIVQDLMEFGTVNVDTDMTIVCVVGDMDWHHAGFETHTLEALHDIPLRMISYGGSNYNIAVVINAADKTKALNALSRRLFNDR